MFLNQLKLAPITKKRFKTYLRQLLAHAKRERLIKENYATLIRELVSNILIHREFMDKTPARSLIYKDKIISENANSPKFFSKIDLNNNEPF